MLICRYRPRGLRKQDEPYHAWWKELSPSEALHAARYGKTGARLPFDAYRARFLEELAERGEGRLEELLSLLRAGRNVTLLCSSACVEEHLCHRSLVAEVVRARLLAAATPP